jgi:predicted transcriptional regulator
MKIDFTPEEEALLLKLADQIGVDPAQMVKDAALRLIDEDAHFRAAIEKSLAQAERGEFINEEAMDARVRRMLER